MNKQNIIVFLMINLSITSIYAQDESSFEYRENSLHRNYLFLATKRFSVTYESVNSQNIHTLFDGEIKILTVPSNTTLTLNIDFMAKGERLRGIDYSQGYIYLYTYYQSPIGDASARIKTQEGEWYECGTLEEIDGSHYRISVPFKNFITDLEVTIDAGDTDLKLAEIEYHLFRPDNLLFPVISKYTSQNLYTQMDFKDSENESKISLNPYDDETNITLKTKTDNSTGNWLEVVDDEDNPLFTGVNNGQIGIGTADTKGYQLAVAGNIISEEVKVAKVENWPDYVFETDYNLKSLEETKQFIQANRHLPEIPNKNEVAENGIDLGEMNAKLLKKIEELTLYLLEEHNRNESLQKELELLNKRVTELEQTDQ